MNTKGISFGSIFKITFIGIFVYSIFFTCISSFIIASDTLKEGYSFLLMQIPAQFTFGDSLNRDQLFKGSVGIFIFGFFFLLSLILTFFLTTFISISSYLGQFLYTRFKPLELNSTSKGLDIISTFKLFIIGITCTWVPFSIYLLAINTMFNDQSETISDLTGLAFTSLIVFPFSFILLGTTCAFFIYIGNRVFTFFRPINITYITRLSKNA